MLGNHAEHGGMMPIGFVAMRPGELARVIATVRPLGIAPALLFRHPVHSARPGAWSPKPTTSRFVTDLEVDGTTGRIV